MLKHKISALEFGPRLSRLAAAVSGATFFFGSIAFGEGSLQIRKIPDEYENTGGHGLALGDAGVAIASGVSAVRLNPAMLPLEKQYTVGADYHWPSRGREFYQAGVVDSKTSTVAAGFTYTGFMEDYEGKRSEEISDSPVIRRFALGLGQSFGKLSLGANGEFVEAFDKNDPTKVDQQRIKGTSFGMGAASLITPTLRVGGSVENLANKRIRDYAPRTMRVGGALLLAGGDVTTQLDYRHRDRLTRFESAPRLPVSLRPAEDGNSYEDPESSTQELKPEQMVIASVSARIYDHLRLLGAYGQALTDDRKSLSGGIALVNNKFALSYAASRPYMDSTAAHQAVHLSISIML